VATPEWEDFTNKDGPGVYWDIMRAVYKKWETDVMPDMLTNLALQ